MLSKLTSDFLCSSGWPQTPTLSASASLMLRLQCVPPHPVLASFSFLSFFPYVLLLIPSMYLYFNEVAQDIDGAGNYLLLTHNHVAQLSSYCSYRNRRAPPPAWVLYHSFSISKDNCLYIVSEIQPQMLVELAPPYFLSNLPPSESRDFLNQLREGTAAEPSAEPESSSPREYGDGCVLQ